MFTRLKRSLASLRTSRPEAAASSAPAPKTSEPVLDTIESLEDAVVVAKPREHIPLLAPLAKKPDKSIELAPVPMPLVEAKPAKAIAVTTPAASVEAKPGKAIAVVAPPSPPAAIDRASLINQAMRIREEKSSILDNLSPGDRARLRALAIKLLVGQPPKPDKLH
ncbi:MAG: hypothetical protein EXQ90_08660 [Rhodospirillales bacterium]|nr:hypothetical protein [Rhodospirillales bacterium]